MPPLVSIITPSYNQDAYLEQTMNSVLDQDYPNNEYLVVDGASTDGSVDIIRRYANKLAWWISESDSGQAAAINKGFSQAKGDIIAWLNSDDYYLPDAISAAVDAFSANPDVSLVYGNVLSVDSDGSPINLQKFSPFTLENLMAFQIISQPAVFMRRSVLEQAGYLDLDYHFLLDHHLWLRIARLAPIVYIPKTLAVARYHPDAKNVSRAAEFGQEAFRILTWMKTSSKFSDKFQKNKIQIMAGAHRLDAFYLIEAHKMGQGLTAYARAFRYSPMKVLRDWKRILYAIASLLGLESVRRVYLNQMQKKLQQKDSNEK